MFCSVKRNDSNENDDIDDSYSMDVQADLQRSLRARMGALLVEAEDVAAQSEAAAPELLQSSAVYCSAFQVAMPQRALLHVKV